LPAAAALARLFVNHAGRAMQRLMGGAAMPSVARCFVLTGLPGLGLAAHAATTATFDDLSALPGTDGQSGLFYANGDSLVYAGVTWDDRFRVVGDAYRVDPGPPAGPMYGIPHFRQLFRHQRG
jgi:hypothetical protein